VRITDTASSHHFSPKNATEEGITIDFSDEHPRNALASIRSSLEFDSNVNIESD
jgi:hypothetical protein